MICQKVVKLDKLLKWWFLSSSNCVFPPIFLGLFPSFSFHFSIFFSCLSFFLPFFLSCLFCQAYQNSSFSSVSLLLSILVRWSYLIKLIVRFGATSLAIKSCHQRCCWGPLWGMMHLVRHRSIPESNSSSPPDLLGLIFVMSYFPTGFEFLLATGHLPWCPLPFPSTGCHSSGSAENPVRFQFSAIQKIKLSALCSFKS